MGFRLRPRIGQSEADGIPVPIPFAIRIELLTERFFQKIQVFLLTSILQIGCSACKISERVYQKFGGEILRVESRVLKIVNVAPHTLYKVLQS